MVMFNSNATTQNSGFTAYYTSAVGVEDNNPQPQTSVSVYPVPANKNITLSLELTAVSNAEVHIVDLLGKPVYKELIRDASGDFQKNIDVSAFAEGIYFVKVSIGKELFTKKMIIQR